jgi:hypothetical protein
VIAAVRCPRALSAAALACSRSASSNSLHAVWTSTNR